jgi:hypothetical protein
MATSNGKQAASASAEPLQEGETDPGSQYSDDEPIGLADLYDQQQRIIELMQLALAPQLRKQALGQALATKRAEARADGPAFPGSAPAWFKAMAVRRADLADAPPSAHQLVTDAMRNAPALGTPAKTAAAAYKALDAAGKRAVQAAYRGHLDTLVEPAVV